MGRVKSPALFVMIVILGWIAFAIIILVFRPRCTHCGWWQVTHRGTYEDDDNIIELYQCRRCKKYYEVWL